MNQISSNTKHIYPAGEKQPINHMCTCSRKQSSALNRLVPVASLDPAVSTRTRSELEQSYFNILAQKKRQRQERNRIAQRRYSQKKTEDCVKLEVEVEEIKKRYVRLVENYLAQNEQLKALQAYAISLSIEVEQVRAGAAEKFLRTETRSSDFRSFDMV